MIKIHLDTDLGGDPDDLCALAMLLKWKGVEVAGITTVTEDKGKRAGYTKYALNLAGRNNIPVKSGADINHGFYRYKPKFPPEDKYWFEAVKTSYNSMEEALALLKKNIENGSVIVSIGPFTNLALLDRKYPGILKKANLFLMGGYIYPIRDGFPKWKDNFDYNIQLDVNSAKHVLENSSATLIPLTVTVETFLRRLYIPRLRKSGKLGKLISLQAEAENNIAENEEKIGKVCNKLPSDFLNFQHDSLACAVALGWGGVEIKELNLKFGIVDGWLKEKIAPGGKKTKVVTKVDGEKFSKYWLDIVTS